jgi:hypothetical protein
MMRRPLGRLPKLTDPKLRTLQFESYVQSAQLPIIPSVLDWSAWGPQDWCVMLNDRLGDCVAAAAGHAIQSWTGNAAETKEESRPVTVSDQAVLDMYCAISGYVPGDPSTDRGAYMLDGAKYLRGVGLEGHRAEAFVEVHCHHVAMVRAAMWLFGGLYIGAMLYDDVWHSQVWDAPSPGTAKAGGHAMWLLQADQDGLTVVTWGYLQRVTWAWWRYCVDEAYAFVALDMLGDAGKSPPGFDLETCLADLQRVTA